MHGLVYDKYQRVPVAFIKATIYRRELNKGNVPKNLQGTVGHPLTIESLLLSAFNFWNFHFRVALEKWAAVSHVHALGWSVHFRGRK